MSAMRSAMGAMAFGASLLVAGCGGREPLTAVASGTATGGTSGAPATGGGSGAPASAGAPAAGGASGAPATGGVPGTGGGGPVVMPPPGTGSAGPWLFFDALQGLNRDIYAAHADGSAVHRITTSAATEREPAVSPDGRTLAFSSDAPGSFQIFLMPLPNGSPQQLTDDPLGAQQPSWSPDGGRLAYHNDSGVWVVGADGTGTRSVVGADGQTSQNEHPVFSPSGHGLIFDRSNQIHQVDLDNGLETSIVQNWTTTIEHPSVSPDGHSIAFDVWCDTTLSIWVVPIAANSRPCEDGARITAAGIGKAASPSFAPTGLIAFEHGYGAAAGSGGTAHVAVVNPGSAANDVTNGTDDRNPSWSPVGLILP